MKKYRLIKAIEDRYYDLDTLAMEISEDVDVVVVNLIDDLNDEITEEEMLNELEKILKNTIKIW